MHSHQQAAIVRGPSGSGKSTVAALLAEELNFRIVEADHYFIVDGTYQFDPSKLSEVHVQCLQAFQEALASGHNVVVANTFTRTWEMTPYLDACMAANVPVQVIECRGRFPNIHGVSTDAVAAMWHRMVPFQPSTIMFGYLRSLLVMGARAVLAGLGDKQDRFSRWAKNLVERRGYWKAAVAIAAKNLRLAWAVLHYGDDFRRIEETA